MSYRIDAKVTTNPTNTGKPTVSSERIIYVLYGICDGARDLLAAYDTEKKARTAAERVLRHGLGGGAPVYNETKIVDTVFYGP